MFESILTILIIIGLFYLFFKITKIIWKAIFLTFLIIVVLFSIMAYFVYSDVQELKNSEKLILFGYDNEVLTGAHDEGFLSLKYLNNTWLSKLNSLENIKDLSNDDYLLIYINLSLIDQVEEPIVIENYTLNKLDMINILKAESPSEFVSLINNEVNLSLEPALSEDQMIEYKFKLSAILIKDLIDNKKYKELFNHISIYPNKFIFILIKKAPSTIGWILNNG